MASNNAPTPPANTAERAKNFLAYGFAISIVLHLIAGPFLKFERTQTTEDQPQKVTVVRVPTPPPTPPPTPTPHPTPPPTPPPKQTPPPQQTPAPQQPKIKINTQKTESRGSTTTENTNRYTTGNTQGIPQGQGTAAPSTAPPATPAPATPPPPTPKPTPTPVSCARPNVAATTLRAVEPDTPPLAQQQGITGTVQVVVSLDAASHVTGTRIQSSPSALLNNAALSAARQSTFQTEIRDCKPIAADYIFTVDFSSQ
jgi:periplasmic protein TonB